MMIFRRRSVAVWLVAIGLSMLLTARVAGQDRIFEWAERLETGQVLEVKGVKGAVIARPASGASAEVRALIEGHGDDPYGVRIDVVEHDGGVTLCAVYPGEGNECAPGDEGRMNVHDNDVEVEFRVRVPEGIRFAGRTVNGKVEIRRLASDVTAETVNGGIDLETDGSARAMTVNGSITAQVGRFAGADPSSFETVNGSIEVTLPEGVGASVHAGTTNGRIVTDFPLTVRGRFGSRSVRGTIGGGGRELRLQTTNGAIEIRKAE